MPPKVSVIMNCRNGEKYLREAIESVYAQTHKDWELIFYDNLSTDGSPEIAKSYDGRLKYFRGTEPLPLGVARNKAVEKATGEFIAFLDTDDIWMPEHLSLHLDAFRGDTVVVYSNFIIRDIEGGREYIPFDPKREFHSGDIARRLSKKSFVWLQAMTVRAEAVRRLEYVFDPELLTAEDFDFALRLSMLGNFNFVPEATLVYRMHGGGLTARKRHYFAHDFSYILMKYKGKVAPPVLRNLAGQYLITVRLDLGEAGFRVFPFLRLMGLRQAVLSFLMFLFPGKSIWELKEKAMKPLRFIDSLFGRGR